MARSIAVIQQSLTDRIAADAALSAALTSVSNTAMYKLMIYVFAYVSFVGELTYDLFKADVNEIIANKNPHTALWYVNKAKDFQLGYDLVAEKDYYDNTGVADDVVAASKIVAYAAFVELPFVRMKLAKLNGNNLAPLTEDERAAVVAYILRIKDAGVKLKNETITSTAPDNLKLSLRIIFNPLVLNSAGERLDGASATPVKDAVKSYLQNLDFNGLFSVQKLVDTLQTVEGIEDLHVDQVQSKYGALLFTTIDINRIADSGYFVIEDADITIEYEPQQ